MIEFDYQLFQKWDHSLNLNTRYRIFLTFLKDLSLRTSTVMVDTFLLHKKQKKRTIINSSSREGKAESVTIICVIYCEI